jgi:hypothetical protein
LTTTAVGSGQAPAPIAAATVAEGADMSFLITAVSAMMLLTGATGDGTHFVPDATEIEWNGTVATVSFREVEVALESDATTVSVDVTAGVDAVCRRGASTIEVHRSATALDVHDYPISDDGTVDGVARVPLEVTGWRIAGYTCVLTGVSVTAALEDFWTGATLVHEG